MCATALLHAIVYYVCNKLILCPTNLWRVFKYEKESMGPKATGKHVCNLYDSPFNIDTIRLLEKGLKYILNALRGRKTVPKSQIQDFCRKLRLKYLFTCSDIQTDKSLNSIRNLDLIQVASKMQLWKNEEFDHYRNLYTS